MFHKFRLHLYGAIGVKTPAREWLQVIIDDGDDEAEAKEKALAEHVARHPEDVGRTVEDFNWVLNVIVRPVRLVSGMPTMKG